MYSKDMIGNLVRVFSRNEGVPLEELIVVGEAATVLNNQVKACRAIDVKVSSEVFSMLKNKHPEDFYAKSVGGKEQPAIAFDNVEVFEFPANEKLSVQLSDFGIRFIPMKP